MREQKKEMGRAGRYSENTLTETTGHGTNNIVKF